MNNAKSPFASGAKGRVIRGTTLIGESSIEASSHSQPVNEGYPSLGLLSPAQLPGEFSLCLAFPGTPIAGLPPGLSQLAEGMTYYSCSQLLQYYPNSGPYPRPSQVNPDYPFTYVSQPCGSFSPLVMEKNSSCSFSVIGPREPAPTGRPSMVLIGVISAAVPVKNTSSAA